MRASPWVPATCLVAMFSACTQTLTMADNVTQQPGRAAHGGSSVSWRDAIAAIATSDRYGGITLREHEGLLPIGVDPESKLWEFVHVASGAPGKAIPARDPATGRVTVRAHGTVYQGAHAVGSALQVPLTLDLPVALGEILEFSCEFDRVGHVDAPALVLGGATIGG